jgi:hypothetical protein
MIDYLLSPAKGYYCRKLGEQGFFLKMFLFYSSLQLAKTLSGFRDLGKKQEQKKFVFPSKKICAPTRKKNFA